MDKLCLQVPVHDPGDYREKRFGVVMSTGAVGTDNRIYVKIPKHSVVTTESRDLHEEKYTSGVAEGHKEYATRTKELKRNGKKDELFKIFAINVPFKYTIQYNLIVSKDLCSSIWAGDDIYLIDQEFKVVYKTFSGDIDMPVMFLTFSIGIEDSIRDIKLCCNKDIIDTLKGLSIIARKKKSNVYGMSSDGY